MNKARGGDGIPAEVFQLPKDYAVKVLHSNRTLWSPSFAFKSENLPTGSLYLADFKFSTNINTNSPYKSKK